jgi:hypothetical protein
MMRRYLSRSALRYSPVIIGVLLILLLLVLIPTTEPLSTSTNLGAGTTSNGGTQSGTQAGSQSTQSGTQGGIQSGTSASNGTTNGTTNGTGNGTTNGITANGTSGTDNGTTSGGQQSETGGVSKTGITCTGAARQFTWSGHSPNCVPAFSGSNGGATAHGVTASTITLTFRTPSSAEDAAISAAAGAANVNYPAMVADFQTYISYFNKQFELYGRHVVLRAYNGQGDYINEDQGQGLPQAQNDAVTAHDMGAFGDVTFSLGSSQPYEEDLADEHVMSFSGVAQPESWFQQFAPYEWSVQGPTGTVGIQEAAAVVCRRIAGMPAIYAGDAGLKTKQRTFGIIYPQIPNYQLEASTYKTLIKQECNQDVKEADGYAVNVVQFAGLAATIVAKMKSEGITTILCACDPIFPLFLTDNANGNEYHPEWVYASVGDPAGRLYNANEWAHEFGSGAQSPDPKTTEAFKVYQLASPGRQPAEGSGNGGPPYYYVPYYQLLQIFEALQAAGPDLTPVTFAQGMFSLPPSLGVDPIGGAWQFGPQVYDPITTFSLAYYNPGRTSAFDGKQGGYFACNSGQIYSVNDLAALGGPGQQLSCFGK